MSRRRSVDGADDYDDPVLRGFAEAGALYDDPVTGERMMRGPLGDMSVSRFREINEMMMMMSGMPDSPFGTGPGGGFPGGGGGGGGGQMPSPLPPGLMEMMGGMMAGADRVVSGGNYDDDDDDDDLYDHLYNQQEAQERRHPPPPPLDGVYQRDIALREVRAMVDGACAWCGVMITDCDAPIRCGRCSLTKFCGASCERSASRQHVRVCFETARHPQPSACRRAHLAFKVGIAGDVRCASSLHESGAFDVDGVTTSGMLFLSHAVCNGRDELVTWAVDVAGADPNKTDPNGVTPLHTGCHQPTDDDNGPNVARGVRALIDVGADVNKPSIADDRDPEAVSQAPLHVAAAAGNTYALDELLKTPGLNVDAKTPPFGPDKMRYTPLLWAVSSGDDRHQITRRLLDAGASVESFDRTGMTALHVACAAKSVRNVKILLEHAGPERAKTLAAEKTGNTGQNALHMAAASGDAKCVGAVLRRCDAWLLDHPDPDGDTPLHLACMYNHLAVVKTLEKHGADFSLENKKGKTPFDLCMGNGHTAIARYMDEFVPTKDGAASHAKPGTIYVWGGNGRARGMKIGTPEWERAMGRGRQGGEEAEAFLARMRPRYEAANAARGVGYVAPKTCAFCKMTEEAAREAGKCDKFKSCRCNKGGNPFYCGTACQTSDWPHHKEFCTAKEDMKEERRATTGGSSSGPNKKSTSSKKKKNKK